ncbi:MAG: hypothetical protein PUF04_09605 [bacterium]|nr:hypothetical protein [bacterium]
MTFLFKVGETDPRLIFKVGDRVQHAQHGLGTIDVIDAEDMRVPYHVQFDNGYNAWIRGGVLLDFAPRLGPEENIAKYLEELL